MPRWIGLLGSWALLVLALGLASFAVAGEWINIRDDHRLERVAMIDKMIAERTGSKTEKLRTAAETKAAQIESLQKKAASIAQQTQDQPDTGQTIIVSTAENKLYVRNNGQTIFEAICSTGKGTTLAVDGKTLVFDTPIGKLHVVSKEENPVWTPPDWHYVEQARKQGKRVVRLQPGHAIDADSGEPGGHESGVWGWFGGGGSTLRVHNGQVERDGVPLPPGEMIYAGDAIVIPPVGTPQRQFKDVLGHFRVNLGDGYAIHGTQETDKLGQSVSHGCVRLGDSDIERLYQMAHVGDEVIIY